MHIVNVLLQLDAAIKLRAARTLPALKDLPPAAMKPFVGYLKLFWLRWNWQDSKIRLHEFQNCVQGSLLVELATMWRKRLEDSLLLVPTPSEKGLNLNMLWTQLTTQVCRVRVGPEAARPLPDISARVAHFVPTVGESN